VPQAPTVEGRRGGNPHSEISVDAGKLERVWIEGTEKNEGQRT
jgi:hypothetical protein